MAIIIPLHEVTDEAKVEAIAESMRKNGWFGRPILVEDEDASETQAFTGTHRIAAAKHAGIEPEVYSLVNGKTDIGALMFDCLDDEDRIKVINQGGDETAIEIMAQEA